ncbi:MAG: phosphatase PAP2 family protein [Fibrobacter sp.]|nr:phosphatase PAP2 family protein [Fibrobacter sp.]
MLTFKKFLVAFVLCGVTLCFAVDDVKLYMSAEDLPNALKFYPAPPDTGSAAFAYDVAQYKWGKSMRADSARAALAIAQATVDVAEMMSMFSDAFGMEISEKKTPAIFYVVKRGVLTMRLAGRAPKKHYMRQRPFMYFNEPTLMPQFEEEHRTNGSYPSGHTVRGWAMALLLAEINPAAQDEILKYGYEWGQSRVIAGYHWQSDIEASKAIIAGCFARLHADEAFLVDMKKARAEFKRLSTAKKKTK